MDISDIKQKTSPILSSFGVKKAALFGSFARNQASDDSDIDLLVQLGKKMSLFEFIDLKQSLEDALDKRVDLIQYEKIKPSLKSFILNDQKVFFEL